MKVIVDTSVWSLALRRNNNISQDSNTDFLTCAVAIRRDYEILTTDKDFENFHSYIPIKLI